MSSRFATTFLVLALSIYLCGCYEEEIDKTREEFARQMVETRKTVMQATQDFTTALPGGEYNLLIRDLNGDDPAAKVRAQNFLKSLGHMEDLDTKIEASVWFGFDPANAAKIKVDAFKAPTMSYSEVQERYE